MPTIITNKEKIIDYLGAALLTVALACLVLATSLGGTAGWAWDSMQTIGLFIGAAVAGILFVLSQREAKDPILPLQFFKNPVLNIVIVLFLLFGMSFFGAIIYIPTFAQEVLGFSATNSGVILLPMVLGLTISSIVVGQLVNKTGKYKAFVLVGLAIATIGVFTLTGLTNTSTYWDLAWRMGLAGLGLGVAMPIFSLAVQNALPQKDLGVATASTQLFRSIGGTVGLAVMGGVLNNLLSQKLADVHNDPFVQTAIHSGHAEQFSKIDVNSVQGILSPQGQAGIEQSFNQLPAAAHQQILSQFHHLVSTLQTALASSITQIFMVSASVMAVAFLVSFALKELPLKHHESVPVSE